MSSLLRTFRRAKLRRQKDKVYQTIRRRKKKPNWSAVTPPIIKQPFVPKPNTKAEKGDKQNGRAGRKA